uniref:translation initiation factor 3 n=1 Tax=Gayralia brasiliensis TaxID=1286870 RepID=UPI00241128B0|nr:translation initiation factor 3 [Gayralia brasiliensis]YP_010733711.1 translation initiation factor 3 [Monostroma nitidum]WEG92908.1 translation initiation factor 3 [Gayralia brasiliensis]WEG92982.1 translation initiation factor 3 [Monostroma nitidum]
MDDTSEILRLEDALAQAREAGLNLVEVACDAAPPVCRLMDYEAKEHAKFKSQAEQHEKTRQRQREASKAKEIRVGCGLLSFR